MVAAQTSIAASGNCGYGDPKRQGPLRPLLSLFSLPIQTLRVFVSQLYYLTNQTKMQLVKLFTIKVVRKVREKNIIFCSPLSGNKPFITRLDLSLPRSSLDSCTALHCPTVAPHSVFPSHRRLQSGSCHHQNSRPFNSFMKSYSRLFFTPSWSM